MGAGLPFSGLVRAGVFQRALYKFRRMFLFAVQACIVCFARGVFDELGAGLPFDKLSREFTIRLSAETLFFIELSAETLLVID
jgi:hypothetical protein